MAAPKENVKERNGFIFNGGLSTVVTSRWFNDLEKVSGEDFITKHFTDTENLINQCDEWDKLATSFATPLLDSDWFISGAQTFCPPNDLAILGLKSGGKLNAIAPVNIKGSFFSHLELVGSSTLREPGGLLYDSQESLAALIQAMLNAKKTLLLKRLYKSSPEVSMLNNELKKRSLVYEVQEDKIPYVDTTGDWEIFEQQQISSSRRSSFRRLHRKAKAKGEVSFEVVVPTEENVEEHLEEVYRIEAANWKGRMGTAMKTHPSLNEFFKKYSTRTARQGKLHLFFLKVGEEKVAVQLTVVHSSCLWIYKVGYDEEWSWCSPGFLLMNKVVRFCFENNLERCEFLGYDEQWLHVWANGFHDLVSYSIYPHSATGVLVRLWDRLRTYYHEIQARKQKD